ncbi:hypothetical protein HYV64_04130 [Candidatus Shapirobacteria bacterium]|nr:hypothetical protein [Candidatus Shapirobacteria bacterium]
MNKKTKTLFFILFINLISYFVIPALPARAQSATGLSAIPPRLEVTIKPGETITKELKIRNESKIERIITTTSKDFIVTDSEGTPLQLDNLDESSNRWAASSWIHLSPSNFKLKPGETRSIMITIIAPDDALSGGHYSMILHSPKNESVLTETGSFIETNVGTLVYITVPGNIKEDARVTEFVAPGFSEFGPITFKTIVANLSDIHVTPAGSIAIKNWLGGKTADLPLNLTNIFPNTAREFENTLNHKWLFGRYTATLNAGYGTTGQAISATLFFWVIPWRLIALIIIALILAYVIYTLIRRQQSTPSNEDDGQVEELEKELEALKKKYKDH